MKFPLCVTHRKQTASFSIAGLMLAIMPLWLMLAVAGTSVHAQTPDDVSNAGTTASTTPSPADWTQFHRDNMQRWNPYETVLGVGNVGTLQVKWKIPITNGNPLLSSPAVVNGVAYFGSDDHNVYAVNASTGAKLWSYSTELAVQSSPAVANGVVYIGSEDGNLYALNASTGAKLWSYPTGSNVESSPLVVNGVVYVGSDRVYALNATTGATVWIYNGGPVVGSSPAVANGVVFIGSCAGNVGDVYALNASTGNLLWSYSTGACVNSGPAVANGVVYIASENSTIYALNASTGAKLWSYYSGLGVFETSPAVTNGVVYISEYNFGVMFALNASTGAKLWSYATGYGVFSSPAVANGVVYFVGGDDTGSITALNASTGVKLWSYFLGKTVYGSSPTVVNGALYVRAFAQDFGDFSGNIYAFSIGADLFLRIRPTTTTVHQGDLITYAFPVWNLGPDNAVQEVLNTQVPSGTTFDYIRISGTPGLGTCTHPPYQGTGQIVCHENSAMAPNTTWTVRLTVKVTAPAGTVITESAATLEDTPDPNTANNTATVSIKVQ